MGKQVTRNKTVLLNFLATVLLQGIAFLSSPFISRMLGPGGYGIVSVYLTIASFFSTCFCIPTQSTIPVALRDFDKEEANAYKSSVFSLSSLVYLIFAIVIVFVSGPLGQLINLPRLLIVFAVIHGYSLFCVAFLQSSFIYDMKPLANLILSVSLAVVVTALSIILIYFWPNENNFMGRVIGQVGPYAAVAVGIVLYLLLRGKCVFSKRFWRYCLPISLPVIFHLLANLVLSQSDRLMLNSMIGEDNTGIYSLAYTFASIVNVIWVALNNSWDPYFFKYHKEGQIDMIRKHGWYFAELFTVLAVGFLWLQPEVYRIFADESFHSGLSFIPIIVAGFFFIFLYGFFVNYEFLKKKTIVIAISTSIAALLNVGLNFLWIPLWGGFGAALATLISFAADLLCHIVCSLFIARKEKDFPFQTRFFLFFFAAFALGVGIFYLFESLPVVRWSLGLVLGVFEVYRVIRRRAFF